jgi:DNA-binding protein YbaB
MSGPAGGDPMDDLMSQLANLQHVLGASGVGGPAGLGGDTGDAREGVEIEPFEQAPEVVGSSGGGAVRVHARGDLEFTAVEIDPAVVDPADVTVLEDLVLAAVRDAAEQLRRAAAANLGEMMGGALSGLSGLLGALGQGGPWDDELDDDEDDDEDDEDEDDDERLDDVAGPGERHDGDEGGSGTGRGTPAGPHR